MLNLNTSQNAVLHMPKPEHLTDYQALRLARLEAKESERKYHEQLVEVLQLKEKIAKLEKEKRELRDIINDIVPF